MTIRPYLHRPAVATLLAASLLAAGCGATSDAAEGLEPSLALEVVGTDGLAFAPDAYAIPAGEAIELVLRSEAAVEHDLIVEAAGERGSAYPQDGDLDHTHEEGDEAEDGHSHSGPIGPDLHVAYAAAGEEARSLFTIPDAGVYEVYCSIPGHREAGMTATLTVVE